MNAVDLDMAGQMGAGIEDFEVESVLEVLGPCERKLAISVPESVINKKFDLALDELARNARLPGFRQGRAPRKVLEKKYQKEIARDVSGQVIRSAIFSAVQKEGLDVVGSPELSGPDGENAEAGLYAERNQPLRFHLTVEVAPTFELPPYTELTVEQEEAELLDEEMEEELSRQAQRFRTLVEVTEGEVQVQDVMVGVATWCVAGQEIKREDDAKVIVVEHGVYGLYAPLEIELFVGKAVGETVTVSGALKNFSDKDYEGKEAKITLTIQRIERQQTPPLDDELAKKFGLETLDQLKESLKGHLVEKVRAEINQTVRDSLVKKIVDQVSFDLPPKALETITTSILERKANVFRAYGLEVPSAFLDAPEARETSRSEAEFVMRRNYVLRAIAQKEAFEISDDDVDQVVFARARHEGRRVADLFQELEANGELESIRSQIGLDKALDFLVENAEITVVPRRRAVPEADADTAAPEAGTESVTPEAAPADSAAPQAQPETAQTPAQAE